MRWGCSWAPRQPGRSPLRLSADVDASGRRDMVTSLPFACQLHPNADHHMPHCQFSQAVANSNKVGAVATAAGGGVSGFTSNATWLDGQSDGTLAQSGGAPGNRKCPLTWPFGPELCCTITSAMPPQILCCLAGEMCSCFLSLQHV